MITITTINKMMTNSERSNNNNTLKAALGFVFLFPMLFFGLSSTPVFAIDTADSGFVEGTYSGETQIVQIPNEQLQENADGTITILTEEQASQFQDLNCRDITERNFPIDPLNDPHGFDGDNDGIGCETVPATTTGNTTSANTTATVAEEETAVVEEEVVVEEEESTTEQPTGNVVDPVQVFGTTLQECIDEINNAGLLVIQGAVEEETGESVSVEEVEAVANETGVTEEIAEVIGENLPAIIANETTVAEVVEEQVVPLAEQGASEVVDELEATAQEEEESEESAEAVPREEEDCPCN